MLSTFTERSVTSGRSATRFVVCSLDGSRRLTLPKKCIPEIDESAKIELLIGRDLKSALYVLNQRIGADGLPFSQRLPLGWVIIGNAFLGNALQPKIIVVLRTPILPN